jgi:hypothetical protein
MYTNKPHGMIVRVVTHPNHGWSAQAPCEICTNKPVFRWSVHTTTPIADSATLPVPGNGTIFSIQPVIPVTVKRMKPLPNRTTALPGFPPIAIAVIT